ncbi:MAG: hypothetical protein GX587_07630 [Bacteroidales bacterium]|nr:hypothetical protein [Bacteroidales bacterium]
MKMITFKALIFACLFLLGSCEKEELSFARGDIEIKIEAGEHWLHSNSLAIAVPMALMGIFMPMFKN